MDYDSDSLMEDRLSWQFDSIVTPPRRIKWTFLKTKQLSDWTQQQKQCLECLGLHYRWNPQTKRWTPDRSRQKKVLGSSFEQREYELSTWKLELDKYSRLERKVSLFLNSSYRQQLAGNDFSLKSFRHCLNRVLHKKGFAKLCQALLFLKDLEVCEYESLVKYKRALDFFDAMTTWCLDSGKISMLRFVSDNL